MPRTNNSLFVLRISLFSYHNSRSTSMSQLACVAGVHWNFWCCLFDIWQRNVSKWVGGGWALIRGWAASAKSTFWGWGSGGGRLFEAGRLLTFSTFRVGAYSRWARIRGRALKRIKTVFSFTVQEKLPTPNWTRNRMITYTNYTFSSERDNVTLHAKVCNLILLFFSQRPWQTRHTCFLENTQMMCLCSFLGWT